MDMDGVGGEVELGGDFFFAVAGEEELEGIAHPRREAFAQVGREFPGSDLRQHRLAHRRQLLAHAMV